MNNTRRKSLNEIKEKIDDLRVDLELLLEEEQDYRDNMPENLQGSERYEKADEACDNLSDAVDGLEEVISSLEAAIE